jgi:uncharacterized membrane protein
MEKAQNKPLGIWFLVSFEVQAKGESLSTMKSVPASMPDPKVGR